MTYQATDKLINHYKNINLDGFHLLNIYVGELKNNGDLDKYNEWLSNIGLDNIAEELSKGSQILKTYPFKSKPISSESDFVNTSNYKGYSATYILNEQGNLILEYYGYGKYDIDQEQIDDFRKDIEIDFADEFPNGASDEDVIEIILDELREWDSVQNTPELIQGDFWMCVRESINSPKIYIPFRNDIIVGNKEEWIEDKLKNPSRAPNALFTLQTSFQAIKKMVLFRKKL